MRRIRYARSEKLNAICLLPYAMRILILFSRGTFRFQNRTIVGLSLSILIHVVWFFLLRNGLQQTTPQQQQSVLAAVHTPLQVRFVQSPVAPEKSTLVPKKPSKSSKPLPSRQWVLTRPKPIAAPSTLPPVPHALTQAPPEMDMSSMLDAARARRHAAEDLAASENTAARAAEGMPSANDIARANIAFQQRRASGDAHRVFKIISKGPLVAQYQFQGWTSSGRRTDTQQTITVTAGPNQDIEIAIIDNMIALIRRYYTGDFPWESEKLGRTISLSARQADTAGLQAFLLREFFG